MQKLILLGIDGLSWNLLNKLFAKGKLKNIQKMISEGTSGITNADHPLISSKIWTSVFTGKKPDKHGIVDFFFKEDDFHFAQIWDILHDKGYKVGVYRAMSAIKVKQIDSFFIPSFLAFNRASHPKKYAFVSDLDKSARMDKNKGASPTLMIKTFWKLLKNGLPVKILLKLALKSVPLLFLRNQKKRLSQMKKIEFLMHSTFFFKLVRKHKTELSIFYGNSTDILSHSFWLDFDKQTKFKNVLPQIYKLVDKFVGRVSKYATKNNIILLVMSDHGFAGLQDPNSSYPVNVVRGLDLLKELNLENDVYPMDLEGGTFLRLKPDSTIKYEEFKDIFESIKCNGKNLFIIREMENRLHVLINDFFKEGMGLKAEFKDGKIVDLESIIQFNSDRSGRHCENNGVFLIKGNKIKEGVKIGKIKPYDLTPTILSLLGESIPTSADGRVIKEIFKNEPEISFYEEKIKEEVSKRNLSKDDEEIVKDRLRALGYL